MRVCLIPLRIEVRNPSANLRRFQQRLREASPRQPDLVCLAVSALAKEHQCYICFGMLEKAPEGVYSSAVLIAKTGEIVSIHRKIYEQPPFVNGGEVKTVETELGRLSTLLCGDLFEDEVRAKLDKRLDALILPLARSFDGRSPDLKKTGATGLIVNLLENPSEPEASFGGAMIVDPNGEILAESTHGTDEMLIYDLVPIAPDTAS
ncbi:carbon-nitrogen hydrolase family protein [Anaerolineae bacterium AMX1]|nr:carbon-nitrogen hydrolase family protein [Anaerolineae bacterium AMX1]